MIFWDHCNIVCQEIYEKDWNRREEKEGSRNHRRRDDPLAAQEPERKKPMAGVLLDGLARSQ